jgi:ATP-binding cassette subfamily F protein uup
MSQNLLNLSHLKKSFGQNVLCDDASLSLDAGERIGLIGDNGTGKSTLLKMIAGEEPLDGGQVIRRGGLKVVTLPQITKFAEPTVEAVLAGPFAAVRQAIADYETAAVQQLDVDDALARIEANGGWDWQRHVDKIISQVGLASLNTQVDTLSGGQKKRLAIAQLMLQEPDVVLLDEPTNHLDTETVEWLEGWLCQSGLAAIVVTHDRYFLEAVVHRMAELRLGVLRTYLGGYSDYIAARATEEALETRTNARRAQILKTEVEWARRSPKARTTKSQARLDRVDASKAQLAAVRRPQAVAELSLAAGPRLGKTILELHDVVAGFAPDKPLFAPLNLRVQGGQRWGIVGPNGVGKTTLLKLINQTLEPLSGSIVRGKNSVVATFDQHRTQLIDSMGIQEFLVPEGGDTVFLPGGPVHVSSYLQRFAFPPQSHTMRISQLSGGQKNRLALAQFLLIPANILLLDEPTNDLDLLTLSVLEDALQTFKGCILVVSHDRYFLDKVCTGIVGFGPAPTPGMSTLQVVQGSWSNYHAYAQELATAASKPAKQAKGSKSAKTKAAPAGLSFRHRKSGGEGRRPADPARGPGRMGGSSPRRHLAEPGFSRRPGRHRRPVPPLGGAPC